MGIIHDHLKSVYPSYSSWHEHPDRSKHHFLALFVAAVCVGAGLLSAIDSLNPTFADVVPSVRARAVADVRQLNNNILKLVKDYEATAPEAKDAAFATLKAVIEERNEALLSEIDQDSQKGEADLFPPGLTAQFPDEVRALFEQEGEVTGKLLVYHVDNLDRKDIQAKFALEDSQGHRRGLHFAGRIPRVHPGDTLVVKGTLVGTSVVAASGGSASVQVVAAAASTLSTGPHKMLVVPVTFTDRPNAPYTQADFANWAFSAPDSVAAYYTEDSFGQIQITGDVAAPVSVPYTFADGCNSYDTIADAADQKLAVAGYIIANYNHIFYWYPGSGCSWGGLAYYGSYKKRAWGETQGMPADRIVMIHEMGHQLDALHANTLSCGGKAIDIAGNCATTEYGDKHDPLGGYTFEHSNPAHKYEFGWIPTASVKTVTSSGTYTLVPEEFSTAAVQVLRIAKPDTGAYYYFGFRQPVLRDGTLPAGLTGGAVVYTWTGQGDYTNGQTQFLDTTPGDGNFDNAGMTDGAVFNDPGNGVSVSQVSHSTSSVTLSVTIVGPPCVAQNPTVTLSPVSQTGASNSSKNFTVNVTNTDSSSCPTSPFTLGYAVPAGWTGSVSPSSLTLSPAGSGSATLTITNPGGTADASYGFTAAAANSVDVSKTASANGTFIVFTDTVAPSVNITAPANGATLKGTNTTISATATDNVGIAKVEFYFDANLLATDTSAPYTTKVNARQQSKGAHTITAKAYDAAGNMKSASIGVSI